MSVSDAVVRVLHHKLTLIAEFESQIKRSPRLIEAAQKQLDLAKQELQNCLDTIKRRRMDADKQQLQQREREAKLLDLEGKMNGAKNNREYQTLKEQIAADMQANSVLTDEIFETLEEIDTLQASTGFLQERVKLATEDCAKTASTVEAKLVTLHEELAKAKEELASVEAELSDDFLGDYKRLVASRGEDGLSPLDGRSCGGCNTQVTPRVLDRLRMGQPSLCPSCGRMLYRPEE